MRFSLAGVLLLLASLAPRPAHAQAMEPLPSLLAPPPMGRAAASGLGAPGRQPERRPAGALALGGVLGGGVGLFAGMAAGAWLDGAPDEDCMDFCLGPGLVLGALAGEALGVAAGVHLANGRRGSLPAGALASAAVLTAGLLAGQDSPELLLALPVAQLIGSIHVERRTAHIR